MLAQKSYLGEQLVALDDIASRIRTQNDSHYDAHIASLDLIGTNLNQSHTDTDDNFKAVFTRMEELKCAVEDDIESLQNVVSISDKEAREPLRGLKDEVRAQIMTEYVPTGDTPERQDYSYPSTLPSTGSRESLLAKLHESKTIDKLDSFDKLPIGEFAQSPPKSVIFTDSPDSKHSRPSSQNGNITSTTGNTLRQLDVNILPGITDNSPSTHSEPITASDSFNVKLAPALKRQNTSSAVAAHGSHKLPKKATRKTVTSTYVLDGDENLSAKNFSSSIGPGTGRRLRSQATK